jgi:hypothetical protein
MKLAARLLCLAALCLRVAIAAPLSADAARLLQWVKSSGDHEGAPFIIIDKRQAQLWLLNEEGELLAKTPVLLGLTRGDHIVPGIGERPLARIQPHERTTPAGRFVAEGGYNLRGEDVLWIDFEAAVSMHRVRATHASERRLQRLASPAASDNRISYGCINVPAAFFDLRIRPRFWERGGVVYLLPDTLPLEQVFAGVAARP